MDVLFLSLDFVLPADRGLRVRSLSQLKVLSSVESVERITLLSLSESAVSDDRVRALERDHPKVEAVPSIIQPTHMRRSPRHLPRLLALRARGVPYLVAKHDRPSMRALVAQRLRQGRYDVVYLGHLGMTAYLDTVEKEAPRARIILEEHNVEWEIFARLAPDFRPPLRQLAHLEAASLRRHERRVLQAADAIIAISEADGAELQKLSGRAPVVVPTYIAPGPRRVEKNEARGLGYAGHLAWQPNTQGLDWFCREVWPLVLRRVPDASLAIAGPGLRETADGALAVPPLWQQPGITVEGYVPDLETLHSRCLAMVAPIRGGSGVRMKLLESLRSGMPTITTSDGAAGLSVKSGDELLIADEPAAFAEGVARLLTEAPLREKLREAGYAHLGRHHSLGLARARLEEALGSSPPSVLSP